MAVPPTEKLTVSGTFAWPSRVNVYTSGCPESSGTAAGDTDKRTTVSSFRIVPCADASTISTPTGALDSVTVKSSSGSASVSPVTGITIVRVVSPGANVTCPLGNAPPKSSALAGLEPLPVTA